MQVVQPDLHFSHKLPKAKYPSKQPEQFVSEVHVTHPGLQVIHPPEPFEYCPSGQPLQVVKEVQVVHPDLHFIQIFPEVKYPS